MTAHVMKPAVFNKIFQSNGRCSKSLLSVTFSIKVGKSTISTDFVLSPPSHEICFSAVLMKKLYKRSNIWHNNELCEGHKTNVPWCLRGQQNALLPSKNRHKFSYLQWKYFSSHPHNTRTFMSSAAALGSASSDQGLTQETALTSPVAETATVPAVSGKTAGTQTSDPGLDTLVDSVVESVPNASLLFPDFPTIKGAEFAIQNIHQATGLPWWATITLTAFTLRIFLIMPLSVYSLHNAEKLNRLQPEIVEISKRLKQEVSMAMHQFKWDEKKAKDEYIKNMKRLIIDLQIKNNCHPMKNTASFWLQLPIWISISYSLRNMTSRALSPGLDHHEECKGLTDEGTLWFSDLTTTDSTWILPVMMGCITLFNIEMTHLMIGEVTKYRKRLTLFLRCLALLFIPISSTMPTAMVFYWVNSGFLAAAQNMLNDYSPFRRLVGLGQSQTESTSPLKALIRKAKLKYFNR